MAKIKISRKRSSIGFGHVHRGTTATGHLPFEKKNVETAA